MSVAYLLAFSAAQASAWGAPPAAQAPSQAPTPAAGVKTQASTWDAPAAAQAPGPLATPAGRSVVPAWSNMRALDSKPAVSDCTWPPPDNRAGLANRYHLTVSPGGYDLGNFQKFTPGSGSATLVRAASTDSAKVQQWMQANGASSSGPAVFLTLTLSDAQGQPVATHVYSGARVSKWSVGSMDAGASAISVETLAFSYASETCP